MKKKSRKKKKKIVAFDILLGLKMKKIERTSNHFSVPEIKCEIKFYLPAAQGIDPRPLPSEARRLAIIPVTRRIG